MLPIKEIYQIYKACTGICTDTRSIRKGNLFFALRGPRFDANAYAQEALLKGANYVIIDNADYKINAKCIWVPNVLTCLHRLAHFHRKQFNIPIIGITGTNGKTTTKELIASVLSKKYAVHFTKGNLNNHIGVPLTLLEMNQATEIGIIEMGANHAGEIKMLCNIADPTIGIVTNVGKGHLEGFGSLDGVFRTKFELYDYIESRAGRGFLNLEETCFESVDLSGYNFIEVFERRHLFQSGFEIKCTCNNPSVNMELIDNQVTYNIKSALFGSHNERNIITAIGLGIVFNVDPGLIVEGINNYVPENNRSQVIRKDSNTYYLDAYNANPSSTNLAIEFFSRLEVDPKIIILGDMLELGDSAFSEHQNLFEKVLMEDHFQQIFLIGPIFGKVVHQWSKNESRIKHFIDVYQAKKHLDENKLADSYIYIKGSRSIQLEKLLF